MQYSTYSPQYWEEFRAENVDPQGFSISGTATANTDTTFDFKVPDDLFIRTVGFIFDGATLGDSIKIQIIDIDGVMAPAGTVLKTQINGWKVINTEGSPMQFHPLVPKKALKNLYFRLTYTSVSPDTGVSVAMNLETLVALV